jgi:endo-1,4-beta-mannosidase
MSYPMITVRPRSLSLTLFKTRPGGMDAYVRRFGSSLHHDQFYLNQQIIDQFKNYATQVVNRYINSPSILSWEIANDPRYVFYPHFTLLLT